MSRRANHSLFRPRRESLWTENLDWTIDYGVWCQTHWHLAVVVQSLLYGAVEPATGQSFFLQFSHVDTVSYQQFLDEFSKAYPDSLNILQVDNGRFHTSQDLIVPENVILLFQPPYCPELNPYAFGGAKPYERLWQYLKADLKWATFKTLDQLQAKVDQLLALLSPEVVTSITGYEFILDALSALSTV